LETVICMIETRIPVGCVVMAAGNASRFGNNKLLADAGGKTLIERINDLQRLLTAYRSGAIKQHSR